MKRNTPYFILILILLVCDQLTKFLVAKTIKPYASANVISGFLSLSHFRNKGAIFGMFSQMGGALVTNLLTVASLIALCMVIYYFVKTPSSHKTMKVALSLILAGAVGNLIDRVVRGSVIDFIEVHIRGFTWPTFNVADSCITVGASLLVLMLFIRRP